MKKLTPKQEQRLRELVREGIAGVYASFENPTLCALERRGLAVREHGDLWWATESGKAAVPDERAIGGPISGSMWPKPDTPAP